MHILRLASSLRITLVLFFLGGLAFSETRPHVIEKWHSAQRRAYEGCFEIEVRQQPLPLGATAEPAAPVVTEAVLLWQPSGFQVWQSYRQATDDDHDHAPTAVEQGDLPGHQRYLWADGKWYSYQLGSLFVSSTDVAKNEFCAKSTLQTLFGILPSDESSTYDIVVSADDLQVVEDDRNGPGTVHCIASIPGHGVYKLWFDAEHDYLLRKAVVEKGEGCSWYGQRLPAPLLPQNKGPDKFPEIREKIGSAEIVKAITKYEVDTYEKNLNGSWRVGTATYSHVAYHDDGTSFADRYVLRIKEASPKIASIANLEPEFPDGTRVSNVDETTVIPKEWRNGQIVNRVDQDTLENIRAHSGPQPLVAKTSSILNPTSQTKFCGLYCVYACMRMFGRDGDFEDLLTDDFMSTPRGSSFEDLVSALSFNDLYGVPVKNLNDEQLVEWSYPAILHVKTGPGVEKYTHFVLATGASNDSVVIYDPPNDPRRFSLNELRSVWNGRAILVSDEQRPLPTNKSNRYVILVTALSIACIALLLTPQRQTIGVLSMRGLVPYIAKSVGLALLIASGAACMDSMLFSEGLISESPGGTAIRKSFFTTYLPRLNTPDLRSRLDEFVVVDARNASDYEAGHIPGAINIPVGASYERKLEICQEFKRTDRVLVYCESESCRYDEEIARFLDKNGFSDISVYSDGWRAWVESSGE